MAKSRTPRWAAAALLASTALAAPALAQDAGTETQPPQREVSDENGVNPASGGQLTYVTELSIGPDGRGGLHLVRGRGHGAAQSSYAFLLQGNPATQLTATAELDTITFNKVGSMFVPADGSGATLVQNSSTQWTLTLEDGTAVVYVRQSNNDYYRARGTTVTYPTGERLTLAYRSTSWCTTIGDTCGGIAYATRMQGVSSSLGYLFHYDYVRDLDPEFPGQSFNWKRLVSIKAINTTVDPCTAAADDCTTTQTWPTVSYDTTGGVTDPAGNTWRYTDSTTQFKIRRPGSATDNIVVNIDSATQRTTSVVRDGMTWSYAWSTGANTLTMTRSDPLSHVLTIVSDTTVGLPKTITDELGRVTSHTYNASGQRTKTTLPEANSIEYSYDARGNVTQVKQVAKTGTGLPDIVTSATYPSTCPNPKNCNLPTTATDARGKVTDYTWNANGDPLTVTSPAPTTGAVRPQVRYTYANVATPGGAVSKLQSISQCQTGASCAATADETKTTVTWSNQLLLTGTTRANGTGTLSATTTITNDNVGNPKTIDGPLAGTADTITVRYDNMRRIIGIIDPDPDGGTPMHRATRLLYRPSGKVAAAQIGTVAGTSDAEWAAFSMAYQRGGIFDVNDRMVRQTLWDGTLNHSVVDYVYDGEGRVSCTVTNMDQNQWGTGTTSCTPSQQNGPNGPDRVVELVYDAANQVTERRVAVGTADAATERTLTYTLSGRLQTLKDAENNLTTYEYDGHDRLSKTRMPSTTKGSGTSSATDFEQLTYENTASNTRTSATVASVRLRDAQVIAFGYDGLTRRVSKDLPGGEWDETYSYDNLDRMTGAVKGPITHSFGYDALSRQVSEGQIYGSITRQFDLAGRMTRTTWWDGFFVDYDRLVTGELSKARENGATSGVGVLAAFTYDDLRRRIVLTRGNGALTYYAYDPVSRITGLTHDFANNAFDVGIGGPMTYNPAGQIVTQLRSNDDYAWTGHGSGSTASAADGLNRLVSFGGVSAASDARGNMTSDPTTGKTFGYFSQNDLRSSGTFGIGYDAMLRPIDTLNGGSVTKQFTYDGIQIVAASNPGAGIAERYVWGDGPDELLVDYVGSGTANRRWAHQDERGSVIALSDAAGNVVAMNKYDEFGKPQSGNAGRFQYTGQMWMPEISLYHYKSRVYSPTFGGRFLQTDPIGYEAGPNLYAYVGNDPVNFTDPLGLQVEGGNITVYCGSFCILADMQNAYAESILERSRGPEGLGSEGNLRDPGLREPGEEEVVVVGTRVRRQPSVIRRSPTFPSPFAIAAAAPSEPADHCTLSPEGTPMGDSFAGACRAHDACYSTLGANRAGCDTRFLGDMVRSCGGSTDRFICEQYALRYYLVVRRFGGLFFWYEQRRIRRGE